MRTAPPLALMTSEQQLPQRQEQKQTQQPQPQRPPVVEPGSLRHLPVTHSSKRRYLPPELWTIKLLQFLDYICDNKAPTTEPAEHVPSTSLERFRSHLQFRVAFASLSKARLVKLVHEEDAAIRSLVAHLIPLAQEQLEPGYEAVPNVYV